MHVSEARAAANRLNALKSTGPRTDRGKEASRRNALKHGLSGEGVVASDEDREEVDRRARALADELGASSPLGSILVRKMATLSVRSERAAAREMAAVATHVRSAVDRFDEARVDQAAALFAALGDDPRDNLRRLRKTPEGVDRLILAWQDLRDDLAVGEWGGPQRERAAHLAGERPSVARLRPLGALALALSGGGPGDEADSARAVGRMDERIAEEVAGLEAHRATLDLDAIGRDRLDAPAMALFDASREATLARRYEAAADRGFYRALKELRRSEADFAAKAEAEAAGPPMPPQAEAPEWGRPEPGVGSFGPPSVPGGWDPAAFDRPHSTDSVLDAERRPLVRDRSPAGY